MVGAFTMREVFWAGVDFSGGGGRVESLAFKQCSRFSFFSSSPSSSGRGLASHKTSCLICGLRDDG